ncbi:hypothetical protein GCM10010502_69820 [Kitasatospora aureofaciens]|uniref:Uncharacterized protein n=1 Tax=Kitasatospora aureofaciens TaxID=1894 RepID=A0A8H9HZ39_KITAU|nr:hypothetical protein GCM10010502_69820 [Kitasatospora aureofaciens]
MPGCGQHDADRREGQGPQYAKVERGDTYQRGYGLGSRGRHGRDIMASASTTPGGLPPIVSHLTRAATGATHRVSTAERTGTPRGAVTGTRHRQAEVPVPESMHEPVARFCGNGNCGCPHVFVDPDARKSAVSGSLPTSASRSS